MRVDTGIAGSTCVVWKNREHYLEARKDVRHPCYTFIELVRNGQVYKRDVVHNDKAPESIVGYMREMTNGQVS